MIKGIRIFRSIILSALVVTVFAIANHYWIKSEVITKEERLDSLKARIQTEENRIMVLEGTGPTWTWPSRIEQLSRDLLSFAPIEPARILSLDSISNADFTPESSKAKGLFRISDGGAE